MQRPRVILFLASCLLGVACIPTDASTPSADALTRPLLWADPAPWTIPFEAGTRAYKHTAVPAEFSGRIAIPLTLELAIGGKSDDPAYSFAGPRPHVAVGDDGSIFVGDPGNHRVQIYDSDGQYVATAGRQGQGPGEFTGISALAVGVDSFYVAHHSSRTILEFDRDGTYRRTFEAPIGTYRIEATADRIALASLTTAFSTAATRATAITLIERSTSSQRSIREIEHDQAVTLDSRGVSWPILSLSQLPSIEVGHEGRLYILGGDGYEVAAVDVFEDEIEWVLRVEWLPPPVSARTQTYVLDLWRDEGFDVGLADVNWPTQLPDVAFVRADNHGLLYVFPAVGARLEPDDDFARPVPVDIYDRDANLLINGITEASPTQWQVIRDGRVYGVRLHPETLNWQVVRYRIEWPVVRP